MATTDTGFIDYLVIGGIVVGVGIASYFLLKKIKNTTDTLKRIELEKCNMDDITNWFKSEDRFEKIKSNSNYMPIVLKSPNEIIKLKDNEFALAIFNEGDSSIIEVEIFSCKNVSNEIIDMFGDKDMIILK